jgi:kynurenine formamidase
MDAVWHLNPDRPDLTIDRVPDPLPHGGGLDRCWILDHGAVNVLTDAVSTRNPADLTYPNHRVHAEYPVNLTEVVNNNEKIPMHQGFSVMVFPLRFVGGTASPVRVAVWEA